MTEFLSFQCRLFLFVAVLIVPSFLPVQIIIAAEPKVFTDDDLSGYDGPSMLDAQSVAKKEEDMQLWEKKKDAELKQEKRQQALEAGRQKVKPSQSSGVRSGQVIGTGGVGSAYLGASGGVKVVPPKGNVSKPT